jgi:acetyl-CoA carboxylase biotin carboxyl carrier protein
MDLDQLKQILELVREHELSEFEVEHEGLRLKIRKDAAGAMIAVPAAAPLVAAPTGSAPGQPLPVLSTDGSIVDGSETDLELVIVKSPIVGTFYRSSEPEAPSFVEIGSMVKKGQVLCIIEAMKLMNEIDSECDGEVVNIYIENGQPVQYGERLFAIRTK